MAVRRNQRKRVRRAKPKTRVDKNLSKRITKLEREIEVKYNDNYANDSVSASTATFFLMNGIGQGVDDTANRIGSQVNATSLQLKYIAKTNSANLTQSRLRVMLVWDRQANGTVPTIAGARGILDAVTITDLTIAPYSKQTDKRFKVVYDKLHIINPEVILNATTGATTTLVPKEVSKFKVFKLKRLIKYNDTNATNISGIETNSLHMVFISESGVTNPPTFDLSTRFFYKDA